MKFLWKNSCQGFIWMMDMVLLDREMQKLCRRFLLEDNILLGFQSLLIFDNSSNLSRVLHCQHFSGKTRVMQTLFSVIVFYQDLKALMKNNLAKYPQTSSPFSQQINFQSKLKRRGVTYWLNKNHFYYASVSGQLDSSLGPSHLDCGQIHLHRGQQISVHL